MHYMDVQFLCTIQLIDITFFGIHILFKNRQAVKKYGPVQNGQYEKRL